MSNNNKPNSEISHKTEISRLLDVTNSDSIKDLAEKLGYKSGNAVSNWKKRGLDYSLIVEKFPNVNAQYVKRGKGRPLLDEYEEAFNRLSNQINESGNPYSARDLVLEALESDLKRIQHDLTEVVGRIVKLRSIDDSFDD